MYWYDFESALPLAVKINTCIHIKTVVYLFLYEDHLLWIHLECDGGNHSSGVKVRLLAPNRFDNIIIIYIIII